MYKQLESQLEWELSAGRLGYWLMHGLSILYSHQDGGGIGCVMGPQWLVPRLSHVKTEP